MGQHRTDGTMGPLGRLGQVGQSQVRYRVEPLDIPASKAARRLHLTVHEFRLSLPNLLQRGFPPPDPTTGHFYLPAIDKWMELRPGLTRLKSATILP